MMQHAMEESSARNGDDDSAVSQSYLPSIYNQYDEEDWRNTQGDVQLVVDGVTLLVHKALLVVHSKLFREVFNEQSAQKCSNDRTGVTLLENCFRGRNVSDLKLLLRFLYAPSQRRFFEELKPEQAVVLACLADEYDMPFLRQESREVFAQHYRRGRLLRPDSSEAGVLKWALLADQYHFPELLAQCEHVIIRNFHKLKEDRRMLQLGVASWQRIAHGLAYAFVQGYTFPQTYLGHCARHNILRCSNMECRAQDVPGMSEHQCPSSDLLLHWQEKGQATAWAPEGISYMCPPRKARARSGPQ